MPTKNLSIFITSVDDARSAIIESGLRESGHEQLKIAQDISGIAKQIDAEGPDAIVIDLGDPDPHMLESILQLCRLIEKPIALFVDRTTESTTEAAIDAGISAYIVDGLKKERITPVLEMAISRFNMYSRMAGELKDARLALEKRKVIDRAKGLIMQTQGLSEEEAYSLMRKTAMNQNRKLHELAESLVLASGLLNSK